MSAISNGIFGSEYKCLEVITVEMKEKVTPLLTKGKNTMLKLKI